MHIFQTVLWFSLVALTLWRPAWGGLGLLFGYAVADRAFALIYFRVFSIPLFITEAVLGVMCLHLARDMKKERLVLPISWRSPWFWFLTAGGISLLRGLLQYNPVWVLRDAALAYYAVITLLVLRYARDPKAIPFVFWTLLGGLVARHLWGLPSILRDANFPATPSGGMYTSLIVLGAFCAYSQWERFRPFLILLFIPLLMTLINSEIRTVWVAYAVAWGFMSIAARRLRCNTGAWWRSGVLTMASLGLLCLFYQARNPRLLTSLKREALSFFQGADSPNVITRFAMWEDALESVAPSLGRLFRYFDRRVAEPWLGISNPEEQKKHWATIPPSHVSRGSGTSILLQAMRPKTPSSSPVSTSPSSPAVAGGEHHISGVRQPRGGPLLLSALSSVRNGFRRLNDHPGIRLLWGVPFGEHFLPQRISFMHKVDRYDPHNSLIAVWYRLGAVGLAAFLWLLWREMRRAFQAARETDDARKKEFLLACMTGVAYHLGHSLTDVTLENAFKGGILWLLLGLLISLRERPCQDADEVKKCWTTA